MVVAVTVLGVLLAVTLAGLVAQTVRLRGVRRRLARQEAAAALVATERLRPTKTAERALRAVVDTAVRAREQGVGGLLMSSLDDLSRWAKEDRSELVRLAAADGSVTLMFSDIEGSTSLNEELGDEDWVRLLIAHDATVRALVDRRGGHIVKNQGDGFMIAFGKPSRAVKAALDVQRSVTDAPARVFRRVPINVRIGIHCGPVVSRGDDLFGLNVAIAARVAAEARAGETLISQQVADAISDDQRLRVDGGRTVELKGVPGVRTLYAVTRAGWRG